MTGGADKLIKYWALNKSNQGSETSERTLKGLINPVTSIS